MFVLLSEIDHRIPYYFSRNGLICTYMYKQHIHLSAVALVQFIYNMKYIYMWHFRICQYLPSCQYVYWLCKYKQNTQSGSGKWLFGSGKWFFGSCGCTKKTYPWKWTFFSGLIGNEINALVLSYWFDSKIVRYRNLETFVTLGFDYISKKKLLL